jgi:spore maturation protein CgeB
MSDDRLKLVFLGLSITSSWGNGHATTYRALLRELAAMGHDVLFLERNVPWYAANRDMPAPPFGRTELYGSLEELRDEHRRDVEQADMVVVGSYVPDGIAAGHWAADVATGPLAFYDIDTPVTMASLQRGDCQYLSPELLGRFDLYLSFSGGPLLRRIERQFGAAMARPLYCSVDPSLYYPQPQPAGWDMGYLGTFSRDRQEPLENLMLAAARRCPGGRFVVAGPQYPESIDWPDNVHRIEHLPPALHREFYNSQRFTLNITRADMIRAGYSPSVRLFEAAACGVPIISDSWPGLETFFRPDREILISRNPQQTLRYLTETRPDVCRQIARAARQRVLEEHTAAHRARQFVRYAQLAIEKRARKRQAVSPGAASRPGLGSNQVAKLHETL